jgi:hypothetical protein
MTGRLPWTAGLQTLVEQVRRAEHTRDAASQPASCVELAKLQLADAVLDAVRQAEDRRWLPARSSGVLDVQLIPRRGRRRSHG